MRTQLLTKRFLRADLGSAARRPATNAFVATSAVHRFNFGDIELPATFSEQLPVPSLTSLDFGPVKGSGMFSTVHQIEIEGIEGVTKCALKKFKTGYGKIGLEETDHYLEILDRTGRFDDHIVRYYGSVALTNREDVIAIAHPDDEDVDVAIAQEWINGPTVDDMLPNMNDYSVEERLIVGRKVIRDTLRGLKALDDIEYVHNDIKRDNIKLDWNTRKFKLIDLSNAGLYRDDRPFGNPMYCGPERIMCFPNPEMRPVKPLRTHKAAALGDSDEGVFIGRDDNIDDIDNIGAHLQPLSNKTDVYGAGQVLHEIVEGILFSPLNLAAYRDTGIHDSQAIRMGTVFSWTKSSAPQEIFPEDAQTDPLKKSSGYYDFINCAMHPDHNKRWTAGALLEHPFLKPADTEHAYELITRCDPATKPAETGAASTSEKGSERGAIGPTIESRGATDGKTDKGMTATSSDVHHDTGTNDENVETNAESSDDEGIYNPGK